MLYRGTLAGSALNTVPLDGVNLAHASVDATEAADTLDATAWHERLASVDFTEAADTLDATAIVVTRAVVDEGDQLDTLDATAIHIGRGSVDLFERPDSLDGRATGRTEHRARLRTIRVPAEIRTVEIEAPRAIVIHPDRRTIVVPRDVRKAA